MESTYAYQPEYRDETIEEQQYNLVQTVRTVINAGGRVLIPAFAVGRAQEIACLLRDYFEQGLLDPFPVLMDGLVKAICDVYDANRSDLQGRLRTREGHAIYGGTITPTGTSFYPNLFEVNRLPPTCVVSSSGMLMDGSRSSRYAEVFAQNTQDAIFFSGYLDAESPGARLAALEHASKPFRLNGREIQAKAHVARYHLSAHAPSSDLRKLVRVIHPKKVILVHGDYRFSGDAGFIQSIMSLEKEGIHVHQSANGVPFYL
jgi:Cft2 family RNA processing exonuclease